MTTLTAGQSATVSLKDQGVCAVATNGGMATAIITPVVGSAQTVSIGPLPRRQSFGPYAEGASVVIRSQTAVLDYDQPGGNAVTAYVDPLTGRIRNVIGAYSADSVYDVRAYGAKVDGRYASDASITSTAGAATATIASATIAFTSADVGKKYIIHGTFTGAGNVGYQVSTGTITAVAADGLSATVLTSGATTAISSAGKIVVGTDDSVAIAAALAATETGGQVFFPAGLCVTTAAISVPAGVKLVGTGKPSGSPVGFPRYGSALLFAGYTAGVFVDLSGLGCCVYGMAIDACKRASIAVQTSATQQRVVDAVIARGITNSLKFNAGSSSATACEIYGGFDPYGSPLVIAGDTCVMNCLIYGAGLNKSTVEMQSVTDDCQFVGNHMYRAGWGSLTHAQVPGANLLISQGSTTDTAGGVVVGNTFDSCEGDHIVIALYNTDVVLPIKALVIASNQFYQRTTITDNTYSCIRFTIGNTGSNAVSIRGISINGNSAKGALAGAQKYKSFIHWNINATYGSVLADSIVGNTADNCAALYTNSGAAHTPAYSAGNCTIDGTGTTVLVG